MGGCYQWPSVSEVLDYRQRVKKMILEFIDTAPLELPVTMEHPWVRLSLSLSLSLCVCVCVCECKCVTGQTNCVSVCTSVT